jgi:hypothetical protein
MKSYTDLEQSKKWAEILPIESADMRYGYIAPYDFSDRMYDGGYDEIPYSKDFLTKNPNFSANEYDAELPCWSLAALLGVIPQEIFDGEYIVNITEGCDKKWVLTYDHYENRKHSYYGLSTGADNLVDACVAMIIKLRKRNLL